MKIETTHVTKLVITEAPNLDPIDAFLEDIEPRRGKITIGCYGKSWTAYWGGMGDRTVAEFFTSCGDDYLAGSLSGMPATVDDYEGLPEKAKKHVIALRKDGDLTAQEARDLYDRLESHCPESQNDIDGDLMHEVFGDDWWHCIPDKPNPDYQYLCRIIRAVQEALRQVAGERPPTDHTAPAVLAEIARNLHEQDNRVTEAPIFVVQRKVRDYRDRWEFVTACFTEKGCQDYLKVNGHNLGETRIYAEGSYRNAEWRLVRAALMAMEVPPA